MGDHEDVPGWAFELMREFGRLQSRMARVEGIGFATLGILTLLVAAIAAHVIVLAPVFAQ